jgi:hypothetical protein
MPDISSISKTIVATGLGRFSQPNVVKLSDPLGMFLSSNTIISKLDTKSH